MARRCELTGKGVMTGNNVSHAQNKSKRVYRPNLCDVTLSSDTLKKSFKFRVSANALRSVDKVGGLDAFLLKARPLGLSLKAKRIKVQIERAQAEGAVSAPSLEGAGA